MSTSLRVKNGPEISKGPWHTTKAFLLWQFWFKGAKSTKLLFDMMMNKIGFRGDS